jgi:uncharacterized protein involved in exopolysaccharide biosynthesis
MTPIYRATTVLMPASQDRIGIRTLSSTFGQLGDLAALAGVNIGAGDAETEVALAVLRSREFTEAFIRDKQLMLELFPASWDATNGRWRGSEEDWPTLARAAKHFDTQVRKVSRDKKNGLVTLSIEWKDPAKAALWANEMIARLNVEMRSRAIRETNAAIGYLQKELESTSTIETRESINRLMEAQINQRMLANVTEEYALRVVDRALTPDERDYVRPNKAMLAVLGPMLGLVLGSFAVLVYEAARRRRVSE